MKPLAIALLAILVVVALRRREPDRAVMRRRADAKREWQRGAAWGTWTADWDDPAMDIYDAKYGPGLLPLRTCPYCGGQWVGSALSHPGCPNSLGIQPGDLYPASLLR